MQPFFRSQISVALLAAAIFPAAAQTIITFDVPGSTSTVPMSINSAGQIVGIYQDANRILHGFLRAPDGTITTLDPPPNKGTHTYDLRINGAGTIAGDYFNPGQNQLAFALYANGAFNTLPFPLELGGYNVTTTGINNTGSITGWVQILNPFSFQGFVWSKGGTATVFPFPGSSVTKPRAINAAGALTGSYSDSNNVDHGFVRDSQGVFSSFDPLHSAATEAVGISTGGAIAGYFFDRVSIPHGFVRDASAKITSFDPPKSTTTLVTGMSGSGTIVGYFVFANEHPTSWRSFVRFPGGTFTTFAVPGATITNAQSINAAGAVTGSYSGADNIMHGFLRTAKEP